MGTTGCAHCIGLASGTMPRGSSKRSTPSPTGFSTTASARPRSRRTEGDHMNLTRIISIKERVAISSEWKPDERDFILECISVAIKNAKPRPDLSMEDFRITVIALRKAAHTSHPDLAARERDIAYRIARLIPPAFSAEDGADAQ